MIDFTEHIKVTDENRIEVFSACDLIQRILREIMTSDMPQESQKIVVAAITRALIAKFVNDISKTIPNGN